MTINRTYYRQGIHLVFDNLAGRCQYRFIRGGANNIGHPGHNYRNRHLLEITAADGCFQQVLAGDDPLQVTFVVNHHQGTYVLQEHGDNGLINRSPGPDDPGQAFDIAYSDLFDFFGYQGLGGLAAQKVAHPGAGFQDTSHGQDGQIGTQGGPGKIELCGNLLAGDGPGTLDNSYYLFLPRGKLHPSPLPFVPLYTL
ncbi:NTP pyrophosphohydrolases including oxidative damage repair enzymes [Moorella thermoacetica Y72]|uniref:NTP pyrophosphohydrolases including oxidative damage repair enzymes n=1 Tax=Moorella thermoacetica Y72 TaxID=1325331 RepID=A0A0S6UG23_NEOTH|nr:NTP pyrophosphohydrolases including oxidative damage repair enzymes [Moorella thermoacetica Y72]